MFQVAFVHGFDRAAVDLAQEPFPFAVWVLPWTQYFPNAVFTDLPVSLPPVNHYAASLTCSSPVRSITFSTVIAYH